MKKSTFDEMISRIKKESGHRKKPMDDERSRRYSENEHRIQCACVQWFSIQYPRLHGRLFAVPNGGRRDKITAVKLQSEGVVAGVADLILLKSNRDYGALLVEMKTPKGKQSALQRKWQLTLCSEDEYKYVVCRSLDDFIREVTDYLKNDND